MKNPNPDPAQHGKIPVWNAENWYYEDIEIGHRIRSIRRTLSEGESMQFNALVLDMHPYVADEIFAKNEGIFGRRLVAGRDGLQCGTRPGGHQLRERLQLRLR